MEKKSNSRQKKTSFDKIDYAHKLIYANILNNPLVQKEARLAKAELDEEMIHNICEHSRLCIANWITEKVRVIKIPFIGKILIKQYRELFESKVSSLYKIGALTKQEAQIKRQEILAQIIEERNQLAKLTGSRYGKPKGVKQQKIKLKITFNKSKPEPEDTEC